MRLKNDKRQKNQLVLAFREEGRSEAPTASVEGTESFVAKHKAESPAIGEQLMEEVCERQNCKRALARVKANKGSPGVDGMTVHDLPGYLKQHWPAIREQLQSGTYVPQPVRRVEIPKSDGGVRKLKIAERVSDKRLLKLIRAFLRAGVMEGGLVSPVDEGTPQGGPLSPLLSNIYRPCSVTSCSTNSTGSWSDELSDLRGMRTTAIFTCAADEPESG